MYMTQTCIGFADKVVLGVSAGAEHEFGLKNFPSHQVFGKKEVETPQNCSLGHF